MVVDDGKLDIGDLQDLTSNNLEKDCCGWLSLSSFRELPKSQLYVPPYSIHDMEWYLSSPDDFISLNDLELTPEHQSYYYFDNARASQSPKEMNLKHQSRDEEMRKNGIGIESLLQGLIGFTRKKRRTKNYHQKRKWRVRWVKKRCSHCKTEETPQWRVGPLGPKTLCNACGVRFKSGRLVPEYRPATTPTFDSRKHF
ncbi:Zinc finger, GATA-type [Sesbania bispinosa]|nr:Zinc finger, GATA-type [Sesbania bispinosa]KAJ1391481.1 Zinc finger, GATA-type [Sesbania bispinosa]